MKFVIILYGRLEMFLQIYEMYIKMASMHPHPTPLPAPPHQLITHPCQSNPSLLAFVSHNTSRQRKQNATFFGKFALGSLTLLHSEWPKLYGVLAILSAIGLLVSAELGLNKFCFGVQCD